MKLNNNNLKSFFELSQTKNFTKAARNLAISQSAFSQRIINLELELQSTLIIREPGNIILTPEGERLLRYCELNQKFEEEFLTSFLGENTDELNGSIRIAGFSSIVRSVLIPSLSPLIRNNLNLSLQVFTEQLDDLLEQLKSSKVDFILSNTSPNEKSMKSIFLGYEDNVLVRSNKYPKVNKYLDHDQRDIVTRLYFDKIKNRPKTIEALYLGDVYGLIDGVKNGLGMAIVPKHLIKNDKSLEILNPNHKLEVKLYLTYYNSSYLTRLQKETIKSITQFFKKTFRQN